VHGPLQGFSRHPCDRKDAEKHDELGSCHMNDIGPCHLVRGFWLVLLFLLKTLLAKKQNKTATMETPVVINTCIPFAET
jgi:hypothetical protein